MSRYIETIEKMVLPVIATRNVAAFPRIPISFEVTRPSDVAAVELAKEEKNLVFLVLQHPGDEEDPLEAGLFPVGVVAKLKQSLKLPDKEYRIIADCFYRAELGEASYNKDGVLMAEVYKKEVLFDDGTLKAEALRRRCLRSLAEYTKHAPKTSPDVIAAVNAITDTGMMADYIAANFLFKPEDKARVLAEFDPLPRIRVLLEILEQETQIMELESSIAAQVKENIDRHQREYYLNEQMKVIQNELGNPKDDLYSDVDELTDKITRRSLPETIRKKLEDQVKKLARLPFGSPEASLARSYVEECLELPWDTYSHERLDVERTQKILNKDHEGLEKVKERILEYVAAKKLTAEDKGQILCLVGAPGVGKTSIGASIARALGRKYVRISLGGVRDEADIRGHRKTYIGSMPGRIVNALKQAGTMNPVIALDELDKLTMNAHGDPGAALLEVLDSEQNHAFRDHFIELPVDLSRCLFLATANTVDTIPSALLDRLEIIQVPGYTPAQKLSICKKHLLPKQMTRHGLSKKTLRVSDPAILEAVESYTREQGVRSLDRQMAKLCRKAAKLIVTEQSETVSVSTKNLGDFLGKPTVRKDKTEQRPTVGTVNGLAWTMAGGTLLKAEVLSMPGTGKLELTGSLGEVMKESVRAAVSLIRRHADELSIENKEFYKNMDLHFHFPEGAVPKDGPSAGVTVVTALVSELSGVPVRNDVAMTGEITLRGQVLAIGGLREKLAAAHAAGVKTVVIPKENEMDLDEVDESVKEALEIVFAETIFTVLDTALAK